MNIVFISEHYYPRHGGVSTFVNEISIHIAHLGHKVWLMVPSEGERGEIDVHSSSAFETIGIGVGQSLIGRISPKSRIDFIRLVETEIDKLNSRIKIDVVHVLFGLYSMKYLDLNCLGHDVVKSATVHNIPPQECAQSWESDGFIYRLKDYFRLKLVKWINERRLRFQNWDVIVVPSNGVKRLLVEIINNVEVVKIGHGIEVSENFSMKRRVSPLNILTVSGFTPHKRLHLIPAIAEKLRQRAISFRWYIVGPVKHKRYVDFINTAITTRGVQDFVYVKHSIGNRELSELYHQSNLYVHTSMEEGFGISSLEAASYGVPVIGCETGALPSIIRDFGGELVEGSIESYVRAILRIQNTQMNTAVQRRALEVDYTWNEAARKYIDVFNQLLG